MVSQNKEFPICRTFVSQVFLSLARVQFTLSLSLTHTHTHTQTHTYTIHGWKGFRGWKGFFDILRLDHRLSRCIYEASECSVYAEGQHTADVGVAGVKRDLKYDEKSDYLFDDDHRVTTGSAFVRALFQRCVLYILFFLYSFLGSFFFQKQERSWKVLSERFNEDKQKRSP